MLLMCKNNFVSGILPWFSFRSLLLVIGAAFLLGGCSLSSSLEDFFDSPQSCNEGSKAERAVCLTKEYRLLCATTRFGLRDNLLRMHKLLGKDIGIRICQNHIAVTIGPEVDGVSITGSMAEQMAASDSPCQAK